MQHAGEGAVHLDVVPARRRDRQAGGRRPAQPPAFAVRLGAGLPDTWPHDLPPGPVCDSGGLPRSTHGSRGGPAYSGRDRVGGVVRRITPGSKLMSKTLVEQRPDVLLDPYGRAAIDWTEQGAALARAGDYLVVVGHERPNGAYQPDGDGLAWRAPAPFHTVRFAVAVADAADGRFVPGLSVHLAARQG